MTRYRKVRKLAAELVLRLIFFGSGINVKIKWWLWAALDFNMFVWRKMGFWTMRIYAWLLPRNGNGDNGRKM